MSKVLNIKNEMDKKELKSLLKQVDASAWKEPEDSPLAQFERESDEFKRDFAKKYNVELDNDEAILYKICDVLKKKKRIDYEACWASSVASDIITSLSPKGEKIVKNEFYYKRHEALNKLSEREQLQFLIKNRKYWFSEIQEALDTKNYDLLLNSMVLMMTYSSNAMGVYYDKK